MESTKTRSEATQRTRSVVFVGLTIAIMAVSAWVVVPLGPIPFTLQMFAITFAIVMLSPKECIAAIVLYLALGAIGLPVFSGMSGGIAYVLDENWDFYQRVNKETVSLEPVEHKYDVATLKELIRAHVEATGSPRGKEILDNFSAFLPKFKKVLPYDYDRMLRVIASVEERGLDGEQAQIEAFYAVQKHK